MTRKGMGIEAELGIIILTIMVVLVVFLGVVPYLTEDVGGPKTPYDNMIKLASNKYHVEGTLVKAMMKAGSDFDPSLDGERIGLMALTQDIINDVERGQAAKHCNLMGIDDPQDPEQNINAGACYFSYLLDRYDNNKLQALVAYHWRPELLDGVDGDVERAPSASRNYQKNVIGFYDEYKKGVGWVFE